MANRASSHTSPASDVGWASRPEEVPHVLLVEDDPDRVRLTRHAVETSNAECELEVATEGGSALELVDETPPDGGFDLVLLDIDLPDIPGHAVCERIRERAGRSRVPIVVLTSSDERDDVQASYEAGANSHVTKAVDFQRFREELGAILSYWLEVNQTLPA